MNGLLEKLKAIDKKIWIIVGAAALLVILVTVGLVIGLSGDGSSDASETKGSTVTTVTSTTLSDQSTTTKKTTTGNVTSTTAKTSATTKVTTTAATTSATAHESADTSTAVTNAPVSTNQPTQATPAPTKATQATTQATTQASAVNPEGEEIFGAGSKDQPYLETPDLNTMTVKTVNIPAGKSLYYSIYRVGNMILTIDNANAYVVCDGVRYDAKNGVVSFKVPDALASDAVSFEIGNKGAAAASFTIRFENEKGSQMNPVILSKLSGDNKVSLAEGASQGYYYKYNAEKSGKLRLYMSASVESVMFATNNRNSAQRTTEADALTDAQGTYIELEVQAGDEIIINVAAKPNKRGKYPATDITWSGKYAN